jgi:hypothetical protein
MKKKKTVQSEIIKKRKRILQLNKGTTKTLHAQWLRDWNKSA